LYRHISIDSHQAWSSLISRCPQKLGRTRSLEINDYEKSTIFSVLISEVSKGPNRLGRVAGEILNLQISLRGVGHMAMNVRDFRVWAKSEQGHLTGDDRNLSFGRPSSLALWVICPLSHIGKRHLQTFHDLSSAFIAASDPYRRLGVFHSVTHLEFRDAAVFHQARKPLACFPNLTHIAWTFSERTASYLIQIEPPIVGPTEELPAQIVLAVINIVAPIDASALRACVERTGWPKARYIILGDNLDSRVLDEGSDVWTRAVHAMKVLKSDEGSPQRLNSRAPIGTDFSVS
jgi:hypothetical protein